MLFYARLIRWISRKFDFAVANKIHVAMNGASRAGNSTECTGSLGNSQAEHTYTGSR